MTKSSDAHENLQRWLQQSIALRQAVSREIAKKDAAFCFN